jgi:hypothetical protein
VEVLGRGLQGVVGGGVGRLEEVLGLGGLVRRQQGLVWLVRLQQGLVWLVRLVRLEGVLGVLVRLVRLEGVLGVLVRLEEMLGGLVRVPLPFAYPHSIHQWHVEGQLLHSPWVFWACMKALHCRHRICRDLAMASCGAQYALAP